MNLNKQTKLLLVIALVLMAIMYFYNSGFPIKNAGSLNYEDPVVSEYRNEANVNSTPEEQTDPRFLSKNSAKKGEYKKISYAEGDRNGVKPEFDSFFDQNNSLIEESQVGSGAGNNDEFLGNDNSASLASYKPGKPQKLTDEDIFRSEDYLAQELNKDWFEVMPEPISVKNRHLINVTRPVGVNTTGTTLKNASYDIRGSISIAKNIISPFQNSSIENDINNKGLC